MEPNVLTGFRAAPHVAIIGAGLRFLARVSTPAASRVALELFRTPRRYPTPERERALLAGSRPFAVQLAPGVTLRGAEWGAGPLIMLIHGWEGRGSQLASFAAPLVSAGFRVAAFDAPGHGRSSGRQSSLPQFAWALRGVAEALGSVHGIVGHSLGCAAAALAMRDGLPVPRVVFVAPPLNPSDYTRQFGEMFGLTDDVVDGLRARIEERFLRKWTDYSLAAMAPTMKANLLIFHDRDDVETRLSGSAQLVELWPGARLVATEGLGHRRILRTPEVVDQAVEFLSCRY